MKMFLELLGFISWLMECYKLGLVDADFVSVVVQGLAYDLLGVK